MQGKLRVQLIPLGVGDFAGGDVALQHLGGVGETRIGDFLHMGGERRQPRDQCVKILRIEHQQFCLARCRHRAAAAGSVQQRDFPEESAVRKPHAQARQLDFHLT